MSSATTQGKPSAVTTPAFVVQSHQHPHYQRSKKKKGYYCRKKWSWDNRCYFYCGVTSTLTSLQNFALILTILMGSLCSCVEASDTAISSFSLNTHQGKSMNGGEYPKFDVNDLANLIEIFPEFKQYVQNVVTEYEKQQSNNLLPNIVTSFTTTTTTTSPPGQYLVAPTPPTAINQNVNENIPIWGNMNSNPRKDTRQQLSHGKVNVNAKYDGYYYNDYSYYDDYHPHNSYSKGKGYGYGDYHPRPSYSKGKGGYGYGYKEPGWGWPSKPQSHYHHDHHHDKEKDQEHHYQVGYDLGKDVSCVLSLLGFKSWKDFSFKSVFNVIKKIKSIVLIGLAFKLGIILSPVAFPMLFPMFLLSTAVRIVPILVICYLITKLLAAKLGLGLGGLFGGLIGRENSWGKRANTVPSFLEGTHMSRLWKSIENVTESLMQNESCMEKLVCKINERRQFNLTNIDNKMRSGSRDKKVPFFQRAPYYVNKFIDWSLTTMQQTARKFSKHKLGKKVNATRNCNEVRCSLF